MLVKPASQWRPEQSALGGLAEGGCTIAGSESGNLVIDVVSDLSALLGKVGEAWGAGGRRREAARRKFATRGVSRKVFYRVAGLACFRPGLERKEGDVIVSPPSFAGMPLSGKILSLSSTMYDEGHAYVVSS